VVITLKTPNTVRKRVNHSQRALSSLLETELIPIQQTSNYGALELNAMKVTVEIASE
jgi:hypothetical protein